LFESKCIANCDVGYYGTKNGEIKVCNKCSDSCVTCKDQNTYCTSCVNGQYLINNTCK